ncbi:MAG: hypothetical protein ACRC0C_15065 [Gibbsiella quercinecans]|uniref:hypothetical protein n=1 Tax=Gibbsiella quercinecans TaxID=929813 RepID=UPI003F30036F
MKSKIILISAAITAALISSGCQNNADQYAADVYNVGQVNSKQKTKTVDIISILPAKVAVDNAENKKAAQTFGMVVGALAGAIVGYNAGHIGSPAATGAGAVGGGALGTAAGSMVKDTVMVDGVSLSYKEDNELYTSTQVGKPCMFKNGLAVMITTQANETRIQPNSTCPVEK